MIATLDDAAAVLLDRNKVLGEAKWETRPDPVEVEQAAVFAATAKFLRLVDRHRDAVRAVLEGRQ